VRGVGSVRVYLVSALALPARTQPVFHARARSGRAWRGDPACPLRRRNALERSRGAEVRAQIPSGARQAGQDGPVGHRLGGERKCEEEDGKSHRTNICMIRRFVKQPAPGLACLDDNSLQETEGTIPGSK